jgi:hypothetical protein
MGPSQAFINKILDTFETEEKIGVYYANPEGVKEEDYVGENPDDEEFWSRLPNGKEFGNCTNCAHFVVEKMGEGEVYGFLTENNPVTNEDINACFGHDFAVLRSRFIVDIWLTLYGAHETQMVFDLHNKKDFEKIKDIYGDPQRWSYCDPITKRFSQHDDVPAEKVMRMGRSSSAINPSPTL